MSFVTTKRVTMTNKHTGGTNVATFPSDGAGRGCRLRRHLASSIVPMSNCFVRGNISTHPTTDIHGGVQDCSLRTDVSPHVTVFVCEACDPFPDIVKNRCVYSAYR